MKTNDLKELILSRPDLEITPFVSEEASNPDFGWTTASVYKCSIDKIAPSPIDDERMLVYGEDEDYFIDDYIDKIESLDLSNEEAEKQAKEAYENISWEETILLYIDSY